ncbi:hypothetical protein GQ457_08G037200 [Hibiscus cannabinus]
MESHLHVLEFPLNTCSTYTLCLFHIDKHRTASAAAAGEWRMEERRDNNCGPLIFLTATVSGGRGLIYKMFQKLLADGGLSRRTLFKSKVGFFLSVYSDAKRTNHEQTRQTINGKKP